MTKWLVIICVLLLASPVLAIDWPAEEREAWIKSLKDVPIEERMPHEPEDLDLPGIVPGVDVEVVMCLNDDPKACKVISFSRGLTEEETINQVCNRAEAQQKREAEARKSNIIRFECEVPRGELELNE